MLIIGCGNRDRGDDAAGILAAERLQAKGVSTQLCSGECSELMQAWGHATEILTIDCVVTGALPGTVHVWDAHEPFPATIRSGSSHGFGVGEAVELSKALRCLPVRLLIYGIEGRNFDVGTSMSPEVVCGVEEVVERVLCELTHMRQMD